MKSRPLSDLYDELFAMAGLLDAFRLTTVFLEFRRGSKEPVTEERIQDNVSRLLELAKLHGYKPEPLREGVEDWVRRTYEDLQADVRPRFTLDEAYPKPIIERHEALQAEVARYPADIDKALAFLRAHYENQPTRMVVAHATDHPSHVGTAKLDHEKLARLFGDIADDPLGMIEGYRFLRSQNRKADQEQLDRFIAGTKHDLNQLAVDLADLTPGQHYLPASFNQLVFVWLCSREASLRGSLFSVGRRLAHQLLRWQTADGSCALLRELPEPPRSLVLSSSALLTALVLNLALVFGDPDEVETQLSRGVAWLTKTQRRDGGWEWRQGENEGDLLTALSTIELMKGFSSEENARALSKAEAWVLAAQHPVGGWASQSYDQATLLVLAIEALSATPVAMHGLQRLMRLSREMLFKSTELLGQGETVDRQLAVIAAHHACEMFLYGYFTSLSPEETYVQPNGQTIGLTVALGRLQERLIADGLLDQSRTLPHRQQVQQLSSARDGIVHRGNSVSPADAKVHVEAAHRFIASHSARLLGASIV